MLGIILQAQNTFGGGLEEGEKKIFTYRASNPAISTRRGRVLSGTEDRQHV